MILNVAKIICAEQWRYWLRTKVAATVLLLGAMLTIAALVVNAFHVDEAAHTRDHLQTEAEQRFEAQPDKHPHRMVHYGHYVFRAPTPLSVIEPGVDTYTGNAIFLEGHRQNSAMFAEQRQSAGLTRFSSLTPSFLALVLAPLFIILIGYGSVSREREAGTLTLLLSQGTTRWQLLLGKLLALITASSLFLLPLLLACLYVAFSNESALVVILFCLSYVVYFLLWATVVTACSAIFEKSSVSFTVLVVIWMSACVLLPRLGSSVATNIAPSMGKLEADFKVEEKLRSLGDGHDVNDPAFKKLKEDLLAKYNVDSVDDLPVNFRGIVAQYSEGRQAKVLNEFAETRMTEELDQAQIARQFGWLSPTVAVRSISTILAGTSLETHHRFLREAETLRLEFVQALNKVHAEKLDYKLDMNRNASEEAADKAVVGADNWAILAEFDFKPEAGSTRISNALIYFIQLLLWMGLTALLLQAAVREIKSMMRYSDIKREAGFVFGHRQIKLTLLVVFLLSSVSLWSGYSEMQEQQATIERLLDKDETERNAVLTHQSNYGMVAYYAFHLTYAPPSPLAFAAVGERDVFPWKHRIRMLALEGQIYESDTDNPELAFLGRFDFAFVTSVLLPLFIILLLYDLKAKEREARRFDLLNVTARNSHAIWSSRVLVTLVPLALVTLIPFIAFSVVNGASVFQTVTVCTIVIGSIIVWSAIVLAIGAAKRFANFSATHLASIMLGVWLVTTVIVPVTGHTIINASVDTPEGGDIVLTQREAVNSAWDKPVEQTWEAFIETHPQWADKTDFDPQRDSSFNWKWYYAFQQVGDQTAKELSEAYQAATLRKDKIASYVALLSPSLLTQRLLTSAADTDVKAMVNYENNVREFHASLRKFYYHHLFEAPEFSSASFKQLPQFSPKIRKTQENTNED